MSPATVTPPPTPVAPLTPDVSAWVDGVRVTRATRIRYEEKINDMGSWSLTIPTIPGTAATEQTWFDYGTVVEFRELGTLMFCGIVEEIVSTTVARGEGANQATTYSGRSILAELDRAVVYGPKPLVDWPSGPLAGLRVALRPYPEVRYWNYAAPDCPWPTATSAVQLFMAGQSPPLWPPLGMIGAPTPWPYPSSYWIAPRAIASDAHPAGTWYARRSIATSGALSYDMFVATGPDTEAWVWWDGDLVGYIAPQDSLKPKLIRIVANDATHDVVVKLNHGGTAQPGEITGLNVSLHRHYPQGGGLVAAPIMITSSAWDVVDFGDPTPCFSMDLAMNSMVDACQDRGALDGWTTSFGSGEDTGGELMQTPVETSTPVGNKVIDTFKAFAEDFIEFRPPLQRDLDVWNVRGNPLTGGGVATGGGIDSGVELVPGVNCTELTHHGSAPEVTALLVRWDGGYTEAYGLSEPDPRYEGYLSIPDTTDGPLALYTGQSTRNRLATPSESVEGLQHRVATGLVYRVLDRVTCPDRAGTPTEWRVVGRAVTADRDGRGTVTASLGVPRDVAESRLDRWQRRNLGTLDGRSEQSRPTSKWVSETRNLTPIRLRFSTGGSGVTIIGDRGTPVRPDETVLVVALELEADVAGASGTTTVRLELNGSSLGTASMAISTDWGYAILGTPVIATVLDQLNVETTAAGGHQGITATAICMAVA